MKKIKEECEKFIDHKKKILIALLLTIASVWLVVDVINNIKESKYIGQDVSYRNTISIQATGEVYSSPDLALITASTVTEARTVAAALSQNSEKMNEAIDFLKEQGIEEKDLKTIGFNIYPRYEYPEKSESYYPPTGERVLVGYEVQQSLEIKIRDLTLVGDIIQGITEAGINQMGSLQFTIENQDELKEQAREQAIKEAKEKADKLADQLGVKLTKIINFSESGGYLTKSSYYDEEVMAVGSATPSVEAGENKIEVSVNITYEIN